jgi:hypothetical protein
LIASSVIRERDETTNEHRTGTGPYKKEGRECIVPASNYSEHHAAQQDSGHTRPLQMLDFDERQTIPDEPDKGQHNECPRDS